MNAKKISLGLVLVVLASTIIYLGYQKYIELKTDNFQAIQAVPNNASLIIKSENWSKSWKELNNSPLWKEISDVQKWNDISESIINIKTKIDASVSLKSFFSKQIVY